MKEQIKLENTCYALLRLNTKFHPIAHKQHDLIWYPESALTLLECVQYRPYVKSIVTENPWLISCYDMDNVRVWGKGEWIRPNRQTYGASVNAITLTILGISQTIPSTPMDGGESIRKFIKELEQTY